ncbi:beta strand repeat-containing protein, partial [Pseudomonas koreensis]|uniref:beta strand repeat-containing protein n=1 Tax=Pseudomonas koreensis TaxID=198620 RepID=UPI001B321289
NDAPAGTDKSISLSEGGTYTFSTTDFGFTDPNDTPANAFSKLIITTLPSPSDGKLTLNGVDVSVGQSIPVGSINQLVFTPVLGRNGGSIGAFTFQVQDDGGTINGGVDTDPTPNTITFNIASVNDAPAGTDKSISLNEDGSHTFSATDFGFTDPNDTPANGFAAVVITTLPSSSDGTLTLNGIAVTTGQVIAVPDLGGLVFTPLANRNGSGVGAFTFQVRDDGGVTNGGVDTDPTANTITFDIASVNDAPAGTDKTISLNEDGTHTFSANDFGFTDPNDTPANGFAAVVITTLPSSSDGTLTLNGIAVTTGQVIAVTDLGGLVFTPLANRNGTGVGAFTFHVRDDGDVANGGLDTDPTANTITFNIASVNDAPAGTDKSISLNEDGSHTFSATDFGFTDPNDTSANAFSKLIITTLPSSSDGTLTLNGVAVTAGQVIAVTDLGGLVFTPLANRNGSGVGGFTFQVRDDGSVTNGGVDTDPTANTITFDIASVNDAPAGTDKTISLNEDGTHTFSANDFGFADPNDTPANAFSKLIITTLPSASDGKLTLNGVDVSVGQSISVGSLNQLVFTPFANHNGTATFTFQVQDDGGVGNGGVDTDLTANTITFNIASVNDVPAGTDKTVSLSEGGRYTFSATDFGFTDLNDTPANAFSKLIITTLPSASDGKLTLNGIDVIVGQSISVGSLNQLVFTPFANHNGTATFTFQVQDDGGVGNGGIDTDPTANTITFNIASVNDAPAGTDKTISLNEDGSYTFSANDFGFTDPNDTPANGFATVVITTLPSPSDGKLTLNGVAVTAGQVIAVTDLGGLVFTPQANRNGSGVGAFTFQVRDDGGVANGGVDTDLTANTITFDIASVNDAPAGTDKTVSLSEGGRYTFSATDFGFTDPNDTPVNAFSAVVITSLPAASDGTLTLNGVAVAAGQVITVTDLGQLVFTPASGRSGNGIGAFTFQVRDDGGTAQGGVDTAPSAHTVTFNIALDNTSVANTGQLLALGGAGLYQQNPAEGTPRALQLNVQSTPQSLNDVIEDLASLNSLARLNVDTSVLAAVNAMQWLQGSDLEEAEPILGEVRHLESLQPMIHNGNLFFGAQGRDLSMRSFSGVSMVGDESLGLMIESIVRDNEIYVVIRDLEGEAWAPIEQVAIRPLNGADNASWLHVDPRGLAIIDRIAGQDELHLIIDVQHADGTRTSTPVVIQTNTGEIELERRHSPNEGEPQRRSPALPLDATIITPAMKRNAEVQQLMQIF